MNVSVIIPALNEENSIRRVIELAKKNPIQTKKRGIFRRVIAGILGIKQQLPDNEVIVVDDHSADNTVAISKEAGASVIISTKRGKGVSMREGILVSKGDVLVFLDADIMNYTEDIIERITFPIITGKADFVKGTFEREAGRVTELLAKPLLNLLFPDAAKFSQPLSGIIAGKREFFVKVEIENDYGADIGILLDMLGLGARITEVNIGRIDHKMKQWQQLSPMSFEVAKAILKRARLHPDYNLDKVETSKIVLDQLELAFKESLIDMKKMVIFDLDNTIFIGRFIDKVAKEFGFQKELLDIITANQETFLITKLVAGLLKGLDYSQLLAVADSIPIVPDAAETVMELKKRGYVVGIVSDGYEIVTQHIRAKIGADFAIANELEFSNSIATGEVKVLSYYAKTRKSKCNHNFCKSNVMDHLSNKYGIPLENIIAVGDSEYDVCIVKNAGIGVAFCSNSNKLISVADKVITTQSFKPILDFAL